MKKLLPLVWAVLALSSLQAQSAQRIPDYFGFYLMNIPGFTWVEGARVQGDFKRYTGVLNTDNNRAPLFVPEGHDPVALTLSQASALLLSPGSRRPFDMVGVAGMSQVPGESASSFFVPFYAEINGQRIDLIPTMTASAPPGGRGPQMKPNVGAGGVGGQIRY